MEIVLFIIALTASCIGAVTGIGGGVIIKPVIDILGLLPVSEASFLSGCTVLSMAVVSLLRNRKSKIKTDWKTSTFLAVGASAGGIIGKMAFDRIGNGGELFFVQSLCLFLLTGAVLVYMLNQHRIHQWKISNKAAVTGTGVGMGLISAFLGIGGGPINLAVLHQLFSMETKRAALNSIYVILFSQSASLLYTILSGNMPQTELWRLALMIIGGIGGGLLGSEILKRITGAGADKVFNILMGVIMLISGINMWRCM